MRYYFAPLEGVTGSEYRRAHHRHFPGIDTYYMPFLTPTRDRVFTPRELRNVLPEHNRGFRAVPQILTKNAGDFCWCAGELAAMGYDEINLNLGCPSGTVTAKGKGAGMLADLDLLRRFLDEIFQAVSGKISIKTRLGVADPEEFGPLLELFAQYPVSLLIVHPRVRQDFYRHPVRMDAFQKAAACYPGPLCYNGGLVTAGDCHRIAQAFPQVESVMLGQGLLANPALVQQAKGGPGPDRDTLRAFHDQLYEGYLAAFGSPRNTVFHMKELWFYMSRLFEGREKPLKAIRKADDRSKYETAVGEMFRLPLSADADWSR